MKFGPAPVAQALGAIAAHAVRMGETRLKKGQIIGEAEQRALHAAGIETVVSARLEPGDIGEDAAAQRLAQAVAGPNLRLDPPFTGRVNLFATANGLLKVARAAIDAVNRTDDSITVATLPEYAPVADGDMAATVKIIPFAAPAAALEAACAAAGGDAVSVLPYRPLRVGVVSTLLPGLKPSVIGKTLGVLEARLAPARARIVDERRCPHDTAALVASLTAAKERCDALIVFGASAITDRRDVIPAALLAAGGRIEHFGMPVDPGNLLLLGDLDGKPVIGAPGCARSPKENGFDWVLGRVLAGVPVTRADIQAMGVGGLLMEIESRPQPRQGDG
jgi:molybdenum cofactor cytidylyltransferase